MQGRNNVNRPAIRVAFASGGNHRTSQLFSGRFDLALSANDAIQLKRALDEAIFAAAEKGDGMPKAFVFEFGAGPFGIEQGTAAERLFQDADTSTQ